MWQFSLFVIYYGCLILKYKYIKHIIYSLTSFYFAVTVLFSYLTQQLLIWFNLVYVASGWSSR